MATIIKRDRKDGSTVYQAKIRMKGYQPQSATFERKTDARKWVQDTESAMRAGKHFKSSEAKRRTVGEMIDRYLADILPNKGSSAYQQKNQRNQLAKWKERLGHLYLIDATASVISQARDEMLKVKVRGDKTRSPATVNRYLAILSHVFTVAANEWEWIDDTPMRKVRKLTEPRGRIRFLSDSEREALLAAVKESKYQHLLYPIVVLALSTGARKSEITNLKWSDIDLENRKVITLYETKNGEIRFLPLTSHALEVMKAHYKNRATVSDYVFPSPRNPRQPWDIQFAWDNAIKAANIKDFRYHDLRHSAASYLAMNGASLNEIAEVLGHKSLQMVKRYAHLSEAHTSSVVASMNERIFS